MSLHSIEEVPFTKVSVYTLDIDVTVKFAVFEYKFGEGQRGSTVFETLLKHYPRRTDIWSVYIDMTIKQQAFEQVR